MNNNPAIQIDDLKELAEPFLTEKTKAAVKTRSERRPKFWVFGLKFPFVHKVSAWNIEQAKWKVVNGRT